MHNLVLLPNTLERQIQKYVQKMNEASKDKGEQDYTCFKNAFMFLIKLDIFGEIKVIPSLKEKHSLQIFM
jgi:hypothetical protein